MNCNEDLQERPVDYFIFETYREFGTKFFLFYFILFWWKSYLAETPPFFSVKYYLNHAFAYILEVHQRNMIIIFITILIIMQYNQERMHNVDNRHNTSYKQQQQQQQIEVK